MSEPRVRFIEHRGRQILLFDFANVTDPAEGLRHIAEAKAFVARQPPNSLRILTHVAGSRFNSDIVRALKDLAAHNKPYAKAGAVVGLTGLMRIVYATVAKFSGRNIPVFKTLDEAKDYLAEQP